MRARPSSSNTTHSLSQPITMKPLRPAFLSASSASTLNGISSPAHHSRPRRYISTSPNCPRPSFLPLSTMVIPIARPRRKEILPSETAAIDPALKRAWVITICFVIIATAAMLTLQSSVAFPPDQGFNWYLWKRPDPHFLSRLSAWGCYALHQVFMWGLIAWAQRNKQKLRTRNTLHPVNVLGLAGNAFFFALHYLQTAFFYDGLGQDLPVITSLSSVVFLLVIVLLMEAPRRGLFFGRGKTWFPGVRETLIKYHGHYFAWAITFTFWYHPMESTGGHLAGFFYTMLLFAQGAFMFTRVHANRIWTFVLEFVVLVHGVTVALVAGRGLWPMFAFGFLFIFVATQMHGLGLSKTSRWCFGLAYAAALILVYYNRGWGHLNEVLRIPIIDYLLVALFAGLILLGRKVSRQLKT